MKEVRVTAVRGAAPAVKSKPRFHLSLFTTTPKFRQLFVRSKSKKPWFAFRASLLPCCCSSGTGSSSQLCFQSGIHGPKRKSVWMQLGIPLAKKKHVILLTLPQLVVKTRANKTAAFLKQLLMRKYQRKQISPLLKCRHRRHSCHAHD
ncbi:hypothetical protein V5799_009822 [Amblyomma americanum]|uniref:Uncharacterized protein n=1 Tax=Amblyomma americanum TaxID=6943 RepID=A0AAQ4F9E5_AMBAM